MTPEFDLKAFTSSVFNVQASNLHYEQYGSTTETTG